MESELVSIIIPTFNRERLLKKAIDSVLAQRYQNLELIVVDDGSEDGTAGLVAKYQDDNGPRIVFIQQKNKGPAAARNTGIAAAKGELLAFLDSDDWFDERKLEFQVKAMRDNPSFLVSHTEEIWYRRGKFLNQKKKHAKTGELIFARCLKLCVVGMSTVMARRELFQRVGNFDEDFSCCEDYDLWLRTSINLPFLLIKRPLTIKEGGREDQISSRLRTGMDRFRIRAIMKVLDEGRLSPEQRELALAELVRKCNIYGNGCIKHGRRQEGLKHLGIPAGYGCPS